ncbi:glycoside hydrolase superfamily [Pavlovales sp. CCMP2436]|nr:glycoside hydrolase superfamily [Pavlovales sp. CCMP2436]
MRSPLWLVLAAVWLAVAAGLKARETGHFPPNYAGGDNYYYDDPSLAKLMPLLFRNHANMTCSDDRHSTPFLKQIRGVNLGGWLVLEPWITPSLFYQVQPAKLYEGGERERLEGSQNGLDNSGRAADVRWTANVFSDAPAMQGRTFSHWATRKAEWIGKFDLDSLSYTELYWDRWPRVSASERHSVVRKIMGVQPVNEPWQFTPIGPLKRFYWEGYKIVKRRAPGWKYFMHDSFRLNSGLWTNFMNGCPDVVMDTHIYTAWNWCAPPPPLSNPHPPPPSADTSLNRVEMVGEWSLATDNCAMWLNGFNDNIPGYPMVQCDMVPCPEPYMSRDQPGAPPDPTKGPRGPFGTGESSPSYGMCPVDRAWREPSDAEPGATYDEIIAGVNWACASAKIVLPGCHAADDDTKVAHASKIFNGYFNEYHSGGATCDFGGAADLTDMSSTPKGREPCAQLFASLPGQKGTSGSAFPPAAAPSPVLSGCALLVASLAIGTMLARRHRAARSSQDGTLREQLVHLSARGVVDAEAASQAPESHPRLSAARHSS